MNVFNRLVVLLLLLLIIMATALIVIVPQETFRLVAGTFDWLRQSSSDYINSGDRLFFAGGRVLVGGVIVLRDQPPVPPLAHRTAAGVQY